MSRATVPPVLAATDARLLVDGVVAIDGLTLETRGARVLLAGDVAPLLRVLLLGASPTASSGSAGVARGRFEVLGRDVARGAHLEALGVALADPPLPEGHTGESYLVWSGRLAGLRTAEARTRSLAYLEGLVGVTSFAQRPLGRLGLLERRLLGLGAATLTSPEVIVVEEPLAGLDERGAVVMRTALELAGRERALVACVSRVGFDGAQAALLAGATSLTVLRGGRLAFHGEPSRLLAGARLFAVTVVAASVAFEDALRALGAELFGAGGSVNLAVLLPEGETAKSIVAAAHRANAALLGCVPVL
ncbi:MAG: ABC transporter ATP-binding protein [Deltaproteobacteria bacterium]|nr:ABC transporter ATP-binding protein [Deltaproteobacteria bacterium]